MYVGIIGKSLTAYPTLLHHQQESALQDFIEALLMFQYNITISYS